MFLGYLRNNVPWNSFIPPVLNFGQKLHSFSSNSFDNNYKLPYYMDQD